MEDLILRMMDESKLHFDMASLITVGIIFALTVAAVIALSVVYKRLKIKLESRNEIRKAYSYKVAFRVVRAIAAATGIVAILQTVGINLAGLSAGFGILVILFILAVKDALQDIFAGVVIVSDKYFNVGDAVEFEGKEGIVVSFSARTTKIEFLDDRSVLSVANRNISKIRTLTHMVDVDLPLSYDLSRKEAFALLEGICERIRTLDGVERCELKGTQNFDASAMTYRIRFFCEPHDRPDIRRSVLRTVQDGLEAAGICVPYQQIDVHSR